MHNLVEKLGTTSLKQLNTINCVVRVMETKHNINTILKSLSQPEITVSK